MKVYEIIVEQGEPDVPAGYSRVGSQGLLMPSRDAARMPARQNLEFKSLSFDDTGRLTAELPDGTKVVGSMNGDGPVKWAEDIKEKLNTTNPRAAQAITARRTRGVSRLTNWWRGTRLGRWATAITSAGVSGVAGLAASIGTFTQLHEQHIENKAALDAVFSIHEIQSRSQEEALRRARSYVDTAYLTAIGAEITAIAVGMLAAGLMTARLVRMIPATIPGAGWVVALLITAVTEGLGYAASWAINKYGATLFSRWFAETWSTAPGETSAPVEMEPLTMDIDDADFNRAIRNDRSAGATPSQVNRVRDQAMQGVDMDRIRNLMRQSDARAASQ